MKKLIIALLVMFSIPVFAPGTGEATIERTQPICPYEKITLAIVQVESKGNLYAFNKHEGAYGAFQVRECRLRDYNERSGKHYKLTDMFDYDKAKEVFLSYAGQFAPDDTRGICVSWNGKSIKNKYYRKVQKYLQDNN